MNKGLETDAPTGQDGARDRHQLSPLIHGVSSRDQRPLHSEASTTTAAYERPLMTRLRRGKGGTPPQKRPGQFIIQ